MKLGRINIEFRVWIVYRFDLMPNVRLREWITDSADRLARGGSFGSARFLSFKLLRFLRALKISVDGEGILLSTGKPISSLSLKIPLLNLIHRICERTPSDSTLYEGHTSPETRLVTCTYIELVWHLVPRRGAPLTLNFAPGCQMAGDSR